MEAKKTHPLVLHYQEAHAGERQEVIMRTVKQSRTALERQVWESVMIDRLSHKIEACLNLKNEWGHSKNPSLNAKARPTASPKNKEEG